MRDIKFRLWHKSIKQMLHFDTVNQVTFRNGSFHWGNWTWGEFLNKFRYILVVGNIFENPDWTEEKN